MICNFLLCAVGFGSREVQTRALAGTVMVGGIILSKIRITNFMKASRNSNEVEQNKSGHPRCRRLEDSVCIPMSVIQVLPL